MFSGLDYPKKDCMKETLPRVEGVTSLLLRVTYIDLFRGAQIFSSLRVTLVGPEFLSLYP